MKKAISVILSLILIFSLVACGTGEEQTTATSEDNSKKVALICNTGGLGDKSFNDSGYRGLERAKEELGIEFTVVEPTEVSQGETYLRQFADAGYGAVISLEYPHAEILKTLADEYPKTVFCATDQVVDNDKVVSVIFDYNMSSYLAGVASAMIASGDYNIIDGVATHGNDTIGVICALESDGFHHFTEAFTQGATAANPDITVLYDWSVGFTDTQLSKQIADNMFKNQNADVVYQVCGLAGLGIFQAAKENKCLAIGVDSDQDYLEPGTILTSVVKEVDTAVFKICEQLQAGTLKGGTMTLTLGDGTEITNMSTIAQYVTNQEAFDAVVAAVEKARQDIISGKIKVVSGQNGERFEG
ncbi:MAG: BMP family ABC transporter substrate-binding protein [Oscillospiraceae bacterium]